MAKVECERLALFGWLASLLSLWLSVVSIRHGCRGAHLSQCGVPVNNLLFASDSFIWLHGLRVLVHVLVNQWRDWLEHLVLSVSQVEVLLREGGRHGFSSVLDEGTLVEV